MPNLISELRQNRWIQSALSWLGHDNKENASSPHERTWATRPFQGREFVYIEAPNPSAEVAKVAAYCLAQNGAETRLFGFKSLPDHWKEASEAFSRPAILHRGDVLPSLQSFAVIIDATGLASLDELTKLDLDVSAWLPILPPQGRILCICRPWQFQPDPLAAAAQSALPDICERWGKLTEAHVHAAVLAPQAEPHLAGFLRFILSDRARYLPNQTWRITDRPLSDNNNLACIFEQKAVLITGCTTDFGQATARILTENGATLFCADRVGSEDEVAHLCRTVGARSVACDETCIAALPELTAVIHCTASPAFTPAFDRALIASGKLAQAARGLLCSSQSIGLNGYVSAFSRQPSCSALTLNAVSFDATTSNANEILGQAELCAFLISPESSGIQGQLFRLPAHTCGHVLHP